MGIAFFPQCVGVVDGTHEAQYIYIREARICIIHVIEADCLTVAACFMSLHVGSSPSVPFRCLKSLHCQWVMHRVAFVSQHHVKACHSLVKYCNYYFTIYFFFTLLRVNQDAERITSVKQ